VPLANGNCFSSITARTGWIADAGLTGCRDNLTTKQIVWKYQEKREYNSSAAVSNAQRLPNGNTLICEGDFGRLFEVTRDGELVWEFVNPYFGEGPTGINNRVFRAYRYSADDIARAKATGNAL
jgi:hypothetical protein